MSIESAGKGVKKTSRSVEIHRSVKSIYLNMDATTNKNWTPQQNPIDKLAGDLLN